MNVRLARRRSRRWALIAATAAVAVAGVVVFQSWHSGRPTEAYWSSIYALWRQESEPGTTEAALEMLEAIEWKYASLDPERVHPLAVDTALRMRTAVVAMRQTLEHGHWMERHPFRAAASAMVGREVIEKLRMRLLDTRRKAVDAAEFAAASHRRLRERYPRRHFTTPMPPDVAAIDEVLMTLDSAEGLRDVAFTVGQLVAALFGI